MYGYNPYNYYPQQQQPIIPQPQIQSSPTLYGKIVDGVETVRATDVPFNQSGIYPKADGSYVYIKSWGNDGTTHIDEYKRVEINKEPETTLEDIKQSIMDLNKKLDSLTPTPSRGVPMTKKKVTKNES